MGALQRGFNGTQIVFAQSLSHRVVIVLTNKRCKPHTAIADATIPRQ